MPHDKNLTQNLRAIIFNQMLMMAVGLTICAAFGALTSIGWYNRESLYFGPTPDESTNSHDLYVKLPEKTIYGLFYPDHTKSTKDTTSRELTIMIHGNAGNVSNRTHLKPYLTKQFHSDLFFWEYPGFGKLISNGKPTCERILNHSESMFKHWQKRYKVINLYCESIGCVVGSHLATKFKLNRLVMQSGPASINDMFHHLTGGWLGGGRLISEFDTIKNCQNIKQTSQIDILHSLEDDVVPFEHAIKIFMLCNRLHRHVYFYQFRGTHNQPKGGLPQMNLH